MSIKHCRYNCKFDPDTQELLCPYVGWVTKCPRETIDEESEANA